MNHDDLLARRREVMPRWLATAYERPIAIDHGAGSYVWDAEGNRYLDFFGGILTTMCGHDLGPVTEAVKEQAGRLLHCSTLYLDERSIELAEMIAELSGIPDAKVFFTTSGTEANDTALMLATSFRRSNQVIALRNGYHGRSFSTVGVTGHRSWSPTSYSGLTVTYAHSAYRLRSPFGRLDDQAFIQACADDLQQMLDTETSGDVACMIAEPIQGVGGVVVPPPGYFAAIKEVLDEHDIPFISDEVQTGWGRTGDSFWGYQSQGIVPDLVTFAKGIGNGLAIGGVVGCSEIMDHLQVKSISTFGGNPLAAAGAVANLRYIVDNDLQGNARRMGAMIGPALTSVAERVPWVAEVRGIGLMWAIELVGPDGVEPDPGAAARVHESCREQGLLIGRGGLYDNVLRIAPPLNVSGDEMDAGLDVLVRAISTGDPGSQ